MPIKGPTTNHVEIRAWAEAHCAVPAEVLPHVVDSEPALLRMVLSDQFGPDRPNLRQLSWDEFFVKFDWLGLTFVYDAEYNEILQIEEKSPYRHPVYRVANRMH